jgi:hypothetical protein
VKLDWMLLANHAEVQNGLLYISGGTWDTTNVNAPLPEGAPAPEGTVALFQGMLVIRLLFHVTETDREHALTVTVMDEDGGQIARIEGRSQVERTSDLPPGWDQGATLTIPLSGLPLPRFWLYRISVQVDGQHLDDLPFRVVKAYE